MASNFFRKAAVFMSGMAAAGAINSAEAEAAHKSAKPRAKTESVKKPAKPLAQNESAKKSINPAADAERVRSALEPPKPKAADRFLEYAKSMNKFLGPVSQEALRMLVRDKINEKLVVGDKKETERVLKELQDIAFEIESKVPFDENEERERYVNRWAFMAQREWKTRNK